MENPSQILIEEFAARRARNSRYSLRAFARAVGISPGCMSEVLSGKRKLTPFIILKFMPVLSDERRRVLLRDFITQARRERSENLADFLAVAGQGSPVPQREAIDAATTEFFDRVVAILNRE